MLLCALPLSGCSQSLGWRGVFRLIERDFPGTPHLSVEDLAGWLQDSTRVQPLLLDVREEAEFAVSHLPGARRISPDGALPPEILALPRDTPIVVYCSVGYRSAKSVEPLREAGFSRVMNLRGSVFAWANAGYPLVRGEKPVLHVHPYDRIWGQLLSRRLRSYAPTP